MRVRFAIVAVTTASVFGMVLWAGHSSPARTSDPPMSFMVIPEVAHDVSPRLDQTGAMPSSDSPDIDDPESEGGSTPSGKRLLQVQNPGSRQPDSALQTSVGPLIGTTPGLNFDGVGALGVQPFPAPDTNGAVGATQYVQWVNVKFAVYDKSTGALKFGPTAGSWFWRNFAAPCGTTNEGDAIAQYDKAAGRWVMSHHAASSTTGPFYQCVAVSTTSDATGSYNRYAFQLNSTYFLDYPKLGVWPDAYYYSANLEDPNHNFNFVAPLVCAFDRTNMLAGNTANPAQCFQLSSQYSSLLPSDLDGSTPPLTGAPNFFLNLDVNAQALDLWKFHVNFVNPTQSRFTGPTAIPVMPFTEACPGSGGVCVPQLGSTQMLDSIPDRLMYRLAYRKFAFHDALLVNHTVNPPTSAFTGIRWYEIRNPNGALPTVYQQGTFSPDANSRWMASMGMDKVGDIAIGYSISSSTMNPAIRYTGRVPTDPLGTLETEASIMEGAGAEAATYRWGDYTGMSIDPVDDCTFFYANEYYNTTNPSSINWSTRVASFKFPGCQ